MVTARVDRERSRIVIQGYESLSKDVVQKVGQWFFGNNNVVILDKVAREGERPAFEGEYNVPTKMVDRAIIEDLPEDRVNELYDPDKIRKHAEFIRKNFGIGGKIKIPEIAKKIDDQMGVFLIILSNLPQASEEIADSDLRDAIKKLVALELRSDIGIFMFNVFSGQGNEKLGIQGNDRWAVDGHSGQAYRVAKQYINVIKEALEDKRIEFKKITSKNDVPPNALVMTTNEKGGNAYRSFIGEYPDWIFELDSKNNSKHDVVVLAAGKDKSVGGIDLNSKNLNLHILKDEKGSVLPLQSQPLLRVNIDGLSPVLINVSPIPSLPQFLGFDPQGTPAVQQLSQALN
jgi:hypothetical protein